MDTIREQAARLATSHVVGMMAAADVLVGIAKAEAPVASGLNATHDRGKYPAGTLRDRIHAGIPRASAEGGSEVFVYADRPFYALFVAKGTARHLIQASAYGALNTPGGAFTSVLHPGSTANPFMSRAFEKGVEPMFEAWKRVM